MKLLKSIPLFFLLAGTAVAEESEAVQLAEEATQSWLTLVDAGNYAESWREAAAIFKQQLTEREWVDTASAVRTPFGSLASRQLQSAEYSTTLPGAPEGEYVVLTFEAEYEHMPSAIETATAMMDEGEWRVAGYYIRPATDPGS